MAQNATDCSSLSLARVLVQGAVSNEGLLLSRWNSEGADAVLELSELELDCLNLDGVVTKEPYGLGVSLHNLPADRQTAVRTVASFTILSMSLSLFEGRDEYIGSEPPA